MSFRLGPDPDPDIDADSDSDNDSYESDGIFGEYSQSRNCLAVVVPYVTPCCNYLSFVFNYVWWHRRLRHPFPTVHNSFHDPISYNLHALRRHSFTVPPNTSLFEHTRKRVRAEFEQDPPDIATASIYDIVEKWTPTILSSICTILSQYTPDVQRQCVCLQKYCGVLIGYRTERTYTHPETDHSFQCSDFVNMTFWICLVQRNWKRVFRERMRLLRNSVLHLTSSDRFLSASSHARFQSELPSLKGMLFALKQTTGSRPLSPSL
jgi:hypothetical protein